MKLDIWLWLAKVVAWGLAVAWVYRTHEAVKRLPEVENLAGEKWKAAGAGASLVVVVPARDEEAKIEATMEALVQADYAHVRVVAVDDRSSDGTGAIMRRYAEEHPARVTYLRVDELPPGWLGKTHAMAMALAASESEYVLFTDADVLFSPSVLRRAVAYAEEQRADHLVVAPTMQVKTWGEGVVLGFFQVFGLWASRPWKVRDAKAKHDVVGIGAFNMVRREALAGIGGLLPQRLAVLEDITLGRRMKAAGLRSRIAFAPGLVLVHWAAGGRGLVKVMSKNLFSAFDFRPLLVVAAAMGLMGLCLGPLVYLFWWWTVVPGLLVVMCVGATYRMYGQVSWIPAKFAWTFPLGVVVFVWAMLRSVVVVWKDRGVRWRGTLYPLGMLRRHNSPWKWK